MVNQKIHKPQVPIRRIVLYSGSLMYNLNKDIANILTSKIKTTMPRILPCFPTTSEMFPPIEDDEMMVSFDITSFYKKTPIIDTLNIIKDCVNNDDHFTWKMAIPQAKFFNLVHLVLTTTWYTFNSQFYHQTMMLPWEAQDLQPQQKFIYRLMNALLQLRH